MIRSCLVLALCSVMFTGCTLPKRSILIVRADAVVLLPAVPTVVNAEYRCCGEDVPTEALTQVQPSGDALISVLKVR
jgi:hypothetical protein